MNELVSEAGVSGDGVVHAVPVIKTSPSITPAKSRRNILHSSKKARLCADGPLVYSGIVPGVLGFGSSTMRYDVVISAVLLNIALTEQYVLSESSMARARAVSLTPVP